MYQTQPVSQRPTRQEVIGRVDYPRPLVPPHPVSRDPHQYSPPVCLLPQQSEEMAVLEFSVTSTPRYSGQSPCAILPIRSPGLSRRIDLPLSHLWMLRFGRFRFLQHRKRAPAAVRGEVRYVNGDEAKKLVSEEGFKILDVRDRIQYERAHVAGPCYHVPLFIENKDNDIGTWCPNRLCCCSSFFFLPNSSPVSISFSGRIDIFVALVLPLGTIIKRQVHNNFAGLFFGLAFTKPNPDFIQSVKKQLPEDTKLLVVCQEGLRSAGAADKLDEAGYDNIACLTSGLQSLTPGTFESVGSTELQNAGKAGLVTIQGKISAVLGTVLICAFLFITFFPEQAEKLLQMSPTS
ncbi:hypothetical protein ZIOFF_015208 [Zingiber officinale]|uniref:Rhodanese domain-containing protein n=1 Tax=Zingiber officinale TaxID=94328 RepID=A0A8J5LT62_ZINOF|nr:hypothetical protein ZIOFF_015208 [Zingiber officinale]